MSSESSLHLTRQRRDEIDEKIEALSKVINKMTSSKKQVFQAKLCNLKLKQQKLIALSSCNVLSESSKRRIITEFDTVIAENDIEIEIESIRRSKKFKRTERSFQVPVKIKHNYDTTFHKTSTHMNISETLNVREYTHHKCEQKSKNMQVVMSHKSTNTEPVYILPKTNKNLPLDKSISPAVDIQYNWSVESNISPINIEKSSSIFQISTVSNNVSQKRENVDSIQSQWFENTFEFDNFTSIVPEDSCRQDIEICNTEKNLKNHTQDNTKNHKNKAYFISKSVEGISTVCSTVHLRKSPDAKETCKENTKTIENTNPESPEATNVTLSGATLTDNTVISDIPIKLHDANPTASETSHGPRGIANLYKSHKKIYYDNIQNNTLKKHDLHEFEHNDDIKIQQTCTTQSKMSDAYKKTVVLKDGKENVQNNLGILQQSNTELSLKSPKISNESKGKKTQKKKSASVDIPIRKLQIQSTTAQDLVYQDQSDQSQDQSQIVCTKHPDQCAKYQDLSTKSQSLTNKSQDLASKCKELSMKSQSLLAICKDLSISPRNLCFKKLSTDSQDKPKSKDLPIKSQDPSTKSYYITKSLSSMNENTVISKKFSDSLKRKNYSTLREGRPPNRKIDERNSFHGKKPTDNKVFLRKTMEKNDVQHISTEDIVNGLFKDLMALKRIKPETDSSSEKTGSCHECGLVYEGHMCAYTIREILENC